MKTLIKITLRILLTSIMLLLVIPRFLLSLLHQGVYFILHGREGEYLFDADKYIKHLKTKINEL